MITEEQLNRAHAEKLAAHSRENDGMSICDTCDNEPEVCNMTPSDCHAIIEGTKTDEAYERWRDG